VLGDDARHLGLTDAEQASHLGAGLPARDDALGDLAPPSRVQLRLPATHAPLGTGCRESGRGALADYGALELGSTSL
jgi:hypothetical protein